ncbi:hypothetical protein D9M68_879300 [compost metagenome]
MDYLCAEEWAREVDDILWRRSKIGLLIGPAEKARLDRYLRKAHPTGDVKKLPATY